MKEINRRTVGLASGVTLLILVARFGLNRITQWGTGSEFPGWAPTFGTFGETIVLYNLGVAIVEPLVLIVLAVGFGYRVGRRCNVEREYRELVDAVAVGSALVVAGWTALTWNVGSPITDGFDVFLALASFVSALVSTTLPVTISALAGAALANFRTEASLSTQPTAANHEQNTSGDHDLR